MKLSLLLDDAKKSHDTLVATLEESFSRIDAPVKRECFDGDTRRWVIGFDLALEYSLLKIAFAGDKNPVPYLIFLRAMNYFSYDVVEFTNEYLAIRGQRGRFVYDDLLDEEKRDSLLLLIKTAIDPILEDTLLGAETADFIIDKNRYQVIEDNILRIVDCFLLSSKGLDETQTRKAIDMVREEVLLPIIKNNDDLLKRTNL